MWLIQVTAKVLIALLLENSYKVEMPNNITANLRNHTGMHLPTSLSGTYVHHGKNESANHKAGPQVA